MCAQFAELEHEFPHVWKLDGTGGAEWLASRAADDAIVRCDNSCLNVVQCVHTIGAEFYTHSAIRAQLLNDGQETMESLHAGYS